jgi:hypothetical protein
MIGGLLAKGAELGSSNHLQQSFACWWRMIVGGE